MTSTYTLAQIAQHNSQHQSNWLLIHNSVYDVTHFTGDHPGGEEVLMEVAGKDATEAFEDVGHSSNARKLMAKYKIGELAEEDRKYTRNITKKTIEPSSKPSAKTETHGFSPEVWFLVIFAFLSLVFYQLLLA